MVDGGANTNLDLNDTLWRNEDKVKMIQAMMRGVVARMKYVVRRNKNRRSQAHFLICD